MASSGRNAHLQRPTALTSDCLISNNSKNGGSKASSSIFPQQAALMAALDPERIRKRNQSRNTISNAGHRRESNDEDFNQNSPDVPVIVISDSDTIPDLQVQNHLRSTVIKYVDGNGNVRNISPEREAKIMAYRSESPLIVLEHECSDVYENRASDDVGFCSQTLMDTEMPSDSLGKPLSPLRLSMAPTLNLTSSDTSNLTLEDAIPASSAPEVRKYTADEIQINISNTLRISRKIFADLCSSISEESEAEIEDELRSLMVREGKGSRRSQDDPTDFEEGSDSAVEMEASDSGQNSGRESTGSESTGRSLMENKLSKFQYYGADEYSNKDHENVCENESASI